MTSLIPDAADARRTLDTELTVGPTEVAALFAIGLPIVYRSLHDGSIPSIKLGARFRIPSTWVRQQLGLDSAAAPSPSSQYRD